MSQTNSNSHGSSNSKVPPNVEDNRHDRQQLSVPSALSDLQLHSTEIGVIAETPDYENLSISAVLHYCKNKILRPYLRLLAVMGLQPTSSDDFSRHCFTNFHTLQVTIFMCIGYVLQYMACFRRDRGFYYKLLPIEYEFEASLNITRALVYEQVCYGNAVFSYLIPSILHLVAYLYTVYLFRIKDNEQLQNLMERAFLLSSNPVNRGNQKKLARVLWVFIGMSIVWMTMALVSVNVMMARGTILFQWLEHSSNPLKLTAKIFLIVCTLWHDMVQGTIITSYCLQGQLLMSHLTFLRAKLLQHTLPALDWMKEISEFKKLLKYFNDDLGPAVCIYTVVNLSWAAAGTAWLLKYDSIDVKSNSITYISVVNVILWILVSVAPFIQAARLTTACSMIQSIGHEVRTRPFVYQGTSGEDLDTILLYTSSLKMCARLFRVPITGRYLCLFLTVISISVLTLDNSTNIMPATASHKFITFLGFVSILHAAYSAAQHRSYLRITQQEFTTLPIDILIQGVVSLFVVMYGAMYIAGDFKEIRAVVDLENKSWETLRNLPSFQTFNHRGRSLSPEYVQPY